MSDRIGKDPTGPSDGTTSDPGVPSVARMYDYFLGGTDNFPVDRRAAEEAGRALPGVAEVARANRMFLQRAVRFVAGRGVDRFLDLGAGLPTRGNVHEIARSVNPGARTVYVDNDPAVTSHARALLAGAEGTAVVDADVRDPEGVLGDPRVAELIGAGGPVCVLLVAVLHFFTDEQDPAGLLARYRDAVPRGSHIIVSHAAIEERRNVEVGGAYRSASAPFVARTREQVTALLNGLTLVEPGVVRLHEWRPEGGEYTTDAGWTAVAHT